MQQESSTARDRILDAAYSRFSRYGVRKVTMDDLASDLRMSKKTLYKHFTGKEELVRVLVQNKFINRHEEILTAMGRGGTMRELFGTVFPLLGRFVQDFSTAFLGDVQVEYPKVWEMHERGRREIVRRFTGLLVQGVERGEVRKCINPGVAADIVQCVVSNYMVPERLSGDIHRLEDVLVTWFSLLAGGMLSDPPDIKALWDMEVAPASGLGMDS